MSKLIVTPTRARSGRGRRASRILLALLPGLVAAACQASGPPPTTPATEPGELEAQVSQQTPQLGEGARAVSVSTPLASATPGWEPEASATPASLEALEIRLVPVALGFDEPLGITGAGDGSGRLYVIEKAGRVLSFDPAAPEASRRVDLDLRSSVGDEGSEQGLLGLAFHPSFGENGRVFVDYTDVDGDTVVAEHRLEAAGIAIDPAPVRVLLRIAQPARNHNGGQLAFGPDGRLYVASGDGGGANDRYEQGQNPDGLLGKILRIDVDTGFADAETGRPAGGESRSADPPVEIWAWGLRNPWRFSFDRLSGDLYIGDVGQASWEEIDRIPADGGPVRPNFGWPVFEGEDCFTSSEACQDPAADLMIPPILVYSHDDGDCSVTGGFVHRGVSTGPGDPIHGAYFFGDYCSGRVRAARQDGSGRWRWRELLDTELAISSFGQDEAGELYLSDLSGGGIYRLEAISGARAPDATQQPAAGQTPPPGL